MAHHEMSILSNEIDSLPSDWKHLLQPYLESNTGKQNINNLNEFLFKQGTSFHPKAERMLAPFHSLAVHQIRCVIVGHYPYPKPYHATGLPFSNPKSATMALSVRTIYEAILNDIGGNMPSNGSLEHLPPQGVLLINRKFTTGKSYDEYPQGHSGVGWEHFSP